MDGQPTPQQVLDHIQDIQDEAFEVNMDAADKIVKALVDHCKEEIEGLAPEIKAYVLDNKQHCLKKRVSRGLKGGFGVTLHKHLKLRVIEPTSSGIDEAAELTAQTQKEEEDEDMFDVV